MSKSDARSVPVPAVDVVKGELVDEPMPKAEAQRLTRSIARKLDRLEIDRDKLRDEIEVAHKRQVWRALGYRSWSTYVDTEFRMSRSRSYQLIAWADLNAELEASGGPPVPTEREARRHREEQAKAKEPAGADCLPVDTPTPPDLPERDASTAEERPAPPAPPAASTKRPAPVESSRRAYNRTDLETVIGALIECKPADIRSLDERLFARYGSWVQQAWAIRPAPTSAIPRSAIRSLPATTSPRARREDVEAGSAKCLHPVTRRIGDRCGACGAATKAAR